MAGQRIGTRTNALRRAQGLSRNGLTRLFGLKDRQTVSAIEIGMPATALESYDGWAQLDMEDLIARLNHVADELCVTSSALRWHLVALQRLTKSKVRAIPEAALRNDGRTTRAEEPPAFSRPFAKVLAAAVDRGHVSVRRAAALVGLPIEGLEELFAMHRVAHGRRRDR